MFWNRNKVKKEKPLKIPLAPHEIFPEILLWERGDELDYDVKQYYYFQEVMENGDCIIKACSNLEIWSIHRLKKWTNYSLRKRGLVKRMDQNNDYSQFIQDFKKAYDEIKK